MAVDFDEYKELEPQDIELSREDLAVNKRQKILKESDGEVFFETRDPVSLPSTPEDKVRVLTMENIRGRFDILSYNYYQTVKLWWIFPDVNPIDDLFDIPRGRAIKIPSKKSIYGRAINV